MLTKYESLQLKGSAILIMVFLHLFNPEEYINRCVLCCMFLGRPLVSQLATYSEICVSLYLFLSGYGLYIQFEKNNRIFVWKRIFKLYLSFWASFIVFVPIGCLIVPDLYPKDIWTFIENITAWKTSYNWTWWFIFPYILLLLVSNILFKCVSCWRFSFSIVFSILIYVTAYLVISLYKPYLREYYILSVLFEFFRMICIFMWGALFVKYDLFSKLKNMICLNPLYNNILIFFILFLSFVVRSLIPIHAASILYTIVFVCCFYMIKKEHKIDAFFAFMGRHSINIWLIHAFFCWYYFSDFIYGLKYPVLIYGTTLGLSIMASFAINKVHRLLFGKIVNKIQLI